MRHWLEFSLCVVGFFIIIAPGSSAAAAAAADNDDAEWRPDYLMEMHNMLNEFKEIATEIEAEERKHPAVSSNIQAAVGQATADCITQFDIDAQTGTEYGGGQNPYYGSNPRFAIELTSGTRCLAEIVWKKEKGQRVQRTIYKSQFKSSYCRSSCISPSTIKNVYLQAVYGGTDGWFVQSIETYYTAQNGKRVKLSSDPYLQKWIDYDEQYKYNYNARHVPLTIVKSSPHDSKCLTGLLIEAQTGTLRGAGFSSSYMDGKSHKIKLHLTDNSYLEGELKSPAYNGYQYSSNFDFSNGLHAGTKCVKKSDIQMVMLVAGGRDGWYATSITTKVKTATGSYEVLTEDDPFNLWLDSDEAYLYHYDATKHVLNLGKEDRPVCDHGSPTCTCKQTASTCIFNFEIDEIQTFTSYKKLKHDQNDPFSMYIRGTQGVSYFINDNGEEVSHEAYSSRDCSKKKFDPSVCTDPQYVDGKTFREAIGVNGQIPGPTIIVHDQQMVVIHVHNNLTLQGVSIHWHGMHQRGTPWMDGVGQVSHCQIGPASTFSYIYKASPSGTFWYHSHSGTQRTDGFYGALIVKEKPADLQRVTNALGLGTFEDKPEDHTISILDWEAEAGYGRLIAGLGYYEETKIGEVPDNSHERYESTRSFEKAEVGPVPFYSGLLNGKGRHNDVPYSKTRLSVFQVEQGKKYRFRLIGAQGLYATKFSIDGHKLTVVATDGYWTKPEKDVDYIIIHTGERFDFILDALHPATSSFWMRAETLEIKHKGTGPPYESKGHVAEGILQYGQAKIHSTQYKSIKQNSPPIVCNSQNPCKAINCPFKDFHRSYHIKCTNIADMRLLEPTPASEMPDAYPCQSKNCQHFINFNFEGDAQSSAVNGRNFILPAAPPQTQYQDFLQQITKCSLDAFCNPQSTSCLCTHVLDLPYDETVQIVLSAVGEYDNAHPIHVHGHTFHVVKVGYPEYDDRTGFIKQDNTDHSVHNPDIKCGDKDRCDNNKCNKYQCTQPSWNNGDGPSLSIDQYTIRKDTVMLPAGGYVVINFRSDNPGFWFLHCHIEVHQLEGMALILNEAYPENMKQLKPPEGMNTCGDFELTVGQYERITQNFKAAMSKSANVNAASKKQTFWGFHGDMK